MNTITLKYKKEMDVNYTKVLFLVTCVFFLWGLSYGLLDVLNKHFQESLHVTKAQSGLLQFSYFGAYFIVALPASLFIHKYGYKGGILLGLCLFAAGALLFIPAADMASFPYFLGALFVLASGLGCLETAANPYATVLGAPEGAAKRLNMAQSFCGLGSSIGPLIGGMLFFNQIGIVDNTATQHDSVKMVYVGLAIIVLLIAFFIMVTPMPDGKEYQSDMPTLSRSQLLRQHRFIGGVITQFFSMAALVGVSSFFINYVTENWPGMTSQQGAFLLSASVFIFMVGRFISTAIMEYVEPKKLLSFYAFSNIVLSAIVVASFGKISVFSLVAIFFFMSIMFPTIFALSIENLGKNKKIGSPILMMSVIGGALSPYIMGEIADYSTTAYAYSIPLLSFIVVFWYGISLKKPVLHKK